jgi:pyruvate/2-oxoglutarate dehydrogenase complex dihydrolipoamide acyltransferase (E2) component
VDALEYLIAQLVGRAREGGDGGAPPDAAPPPQAERRYPQPVVRGRRPAPVPAPPAQPPRPAPAVAAPTAPAPQPAAAPRPPAPALLGAFTSRERLLGALVLAEALAPPPGLRPRSPGGGF